MLDEKRKTCLFVSPNAKIGINVCMSGQALPATGTI